MVKIGSSFLLLPVNIPPPFIEEIILPSLPGGTVVKNQPGNAGDAKDKGLIPESKRSPGGGIGNPLQYSCLENSMDRGTWWATVHGIAKSWTQLSH